MIANKPLALRILLWLTIMYGLLLAVHFFIELWIFMPLGSEKEYLHWNVPPLSGIPAKIPDYLSETFIPLLPMRIYLFMPFLAYPTGLTAYRLYRRHHG